METKLLEEIIKSTKETLSERLSSPLISSFTIAWVIWNYRFLVILFSKAGVTQTFTLIDTIAFPTKYTFILHGILLPLASSLTYIFLYPYPAKFIYKYTLERQRENNEIKQKIEGEELYSIEKTRAIREEMRRREKYQQELIDELNEKINLLEEEIKSKEKSSGTKNAAETAYPTSTEPSQIELLKIIENRDGLIDRDSIISQSSTTKTKTEYDLDDLVSKGTIKFEYNERHEFYAYKLTQIGRKILLDEANKEKGLRT